MALNDNDLLLINDSQDSNEAKKIKYSTLKSNINGDSGNDLQAVTDNGNTTTNGATFGGLVKIGLPADNTGFLISAAGDSKGSIGTNGDQFVIGNPIAGSGVISLQTKPSSGPPTTKAVVTNDGAFHVGGTLPGTPNITLNADGNGIFGGVDGDINAAGKDVCFLGNGVYGSNRSAANSGAFSARQDGTLTFLVNADGETKIGGSLAGNTPTPNIKLSPDGSASFAVGSGSGLNVSENGTVVTNATTVPGFRINKDSIFGYSGGTAPNQTVQINNNGSAKFASDVDVGGWSATNKGLRLWGSGNAGIQLHVPASSTAGCIVINSGTDGTNYTDTKAVINNDGSAHFAGNVTSDGTIGFNLADGTTLDVKERVLNLVARLDALEANEVIDDAVDTSLLSLLASASARLDSIEARLAALEGGN